MSLKPAHVKHWSSCKVVSISAVTSCDPAYSVVRRYCSLSESDIKKKVDEITDLFSDARELLDDAVSSFHFVGTMHTNCVSIVHMFVLFLCVFPLQRSSVGTVYFNDDMQEAKSAVEETLHLYGDLLSGLSEEQRQTVISSIGLKMEELKAQLATVKEHLEDS